LVQTASYWKTGVIAVFSAAILSAQGSAAPSCHATPQETRKQVPWAGNAGEIQWSADQVDCKVDAGGLPWITVSVLPALTADAGQRVLRYTVDTNFSPNKREGTIQVGDATVVLEQAAGPPPGIAYSPSRLVFTFTPGKDAPMEATKELFVGSEQPLVFTATPPATAPWIRVKDTSAATAKTQRSFKVTVTAAGKDPGVYQATIQIEAPGASNSREQVPVTMTVEKAK
jgi:hypothetical protein